MIIKRTINLLTKSKKINSEIINPLHVLKKVNNLDIVLLDDFLDKYLTDISNFIDRHTDTQIKGLFDIDRNDDDVINKFLARELSLKCLYYDDEGNGDYNVAEDYIFDILDDHDNSTTNYSIILAVDSSLREDFKTKKVKKYMSKKSSKQRKKIKERYSYNNPFHRIHGFIITQDKPCVCKTDKILALTVICASPFSSFADIKAVGTYLICFFILYCKIFKYKYAILEVANDEADMPEYNINDDIYNQDSLEEKTVAQLKVILNELDLPVSGKKQILIDRILDSEENNDNCNKSYENRMLEEHDLNDNNLNNHGYGGISYHKGRDRQRNLYCNFYEKYGFRENSNINKYWRCFSDDPYPSMVLKLNDISLQCLVSNFLERKWTSRPSDYCIKYTKNVKISDKC